MHQRNWARSAACGLVAMVVSALAAAQTAPDDAGQELQEIKVTGSRVISNGNDSPTPLTLVTTEQLTATTPTNLADALNNLPVFSGSLGPSQARSSTFDNTGGNYLNLRGLGSVRNLILLDGHRVPPTTSGGTVDINFLPQMLVQRVDVVTGGASAVYGSDAVSGVVNFVLDQKFDGVKFDVDGGISEKHDDRTRKFDIAAGTDILGGRGHIEGSFEHFSSDGIPRNEDRANGRLAEYLAGAGTTASPFHLQSGGTLFWATAGGLAIPLVPGPLSGDTFVDNNGTFRLAGPSDLSYVQNSTMIASENANKLFGRFDFDLNDNLHTYAQVSAAEVGNQYQLSPMLYVFKWILPDDAFLPAAARAALAGPGGGPFLFGKDSNNNSGFVGDADGRNVYANLGVAGKLFTSADFEISYSHGESRQRTSTLGNFDNLRLAAALDAVTNPATGQIVCNVTLTHPGLYPGCVPLNPFGPTSETQAMLDYVRRETSSILTNKMDDLFANVVGEPLDSWAGPVRMALSGEFRRQSLDNNGDSNLINPTTDCVGLSASAITCPSTRFTSPSEGSATGKENVREFAYEVNVPLLKDVFLTKGLDVNGAFRNANYSISGNANTWKVGTVWHMVDGLTFRATRSRDFRAPTLIDLFAPISKESTGYTDLHTGVAGITYIQSQGNPNLKPELGNTTTVGVVFKPGWLPDFSVAVDYYNISIIDAIGTFSGTDSAVQAQCEQSGGTSPSCALYVRPLPFSNHTSANFPTLVYSEGLNLASQKVNGVDTDLNYMLRLGAGKLALRGLVSYQPTNSTQQYPGAPIIRGAGTASGVASGSPLPEWKVTAMISYSVGPYSVNTQTRWRSSLKQSGDSSLVFSDPPVPSVSFTDLSLGYAFKPTFGGDFKLFLSVQNVFDKVAPLWQGTFSTGAPGYNYPAVNGDDIVGRYFTLGLKGKF
jgi:iron complex outermembrane receptor protein